MQAIILAGGKGTQLHPLNLNIPKPMLPLFDRPVLEHTICLLARHGVRDIFIALSHSALDIADYFGGGARWGVDIRYSVEAEPLGSAGAVKQIQSMINDTFAVISGDAVTDCDISAALAMHRSASAIATIMLHEVDEPTEFGIAGCDSAGKITRFLEKPRSSEAFTNAASTGIYIMEPEAISCIPYYTTFDFARDLFPRMLANREPVYGFTMPGHWCDVGNLRQYRNIHVDALKDKIKLDIRASHTGDGVWLGNRAEIHPSVELTSPVYLGEGAIVKKDAVISEGSIIGSESLVDESASIKRSVIGSRSYIGQGASVSHSVISGGCSISNGDEVADQMLAEGIRYFIPAPVAPEVEPKKINQRSGEVRQDALHEAPAVTPLG